MRHLVVPGRQVSCVYHREVPQIRSTNSSEVWRALLVAFTGVERRECPQDRGGNVVFLPASGWGLLEKLSPESSVEPAIAETDD